MIQRETYLQQIRPFIDSEPIKVITGIRRCGKSVIMEQIQNELLANGILPEQIVFLNFEKMENDRFTTATSLHEELVRRASLTDKKLYFFFDEIHEVEDWEKCINSCRLDFDCDIFITGSNAKMLSGEISTKLSGRYVTFTIYPFSFAEFMEALRENGMELDRAKVFHMYLEIGGMPGAMAFLQNKEAVFRYLEDVYNSVLIKDIVKRYNIRNVDLLEKVLGFLMDNVGRQVSANSISAYFKNEHRVVSTDTVLNFMHYAREAFLCYNAKRYDICGKRLLNVNGKYYMADHGFREAILGRNHKNIEQVLENVVYMELLHRGYKVTVGELGEKEIDFICENADGKLYVQVCYLLASEKTAEREFGAYRKVPDNYPKYVVSMDEFDMSRDGIKHCNIRDFLLMEKWG